MPTTQSTRMSTDAKIGLRTHSAASHCIVYLLDAHAVAHFGRGVYDDVFSRGYSAQYRDDVAQFVAELGETLLHHPVRAHDEDPRLRIVSHDGPHGDDRT